MYHWLRQLVSPAKVKCVQHFHDMHNLFVTPILMSHHIFMNYCTWKAHFSSRDIKLMRLRHLKPFKHYLDAQDYIGYQYASQCLCLIKWIILKKCRNGKYIDDYMNTYQVPYLYFEYFDFISTDPLTPKVSCKI